MNIGDNMITLEDIKGTLDSNNKNFSKISLKLRLIQVRQHKALFNVRYRQGGQKKE